MKSLIPELYGSDDFSRIGLLKFEMLADGLRVSPEAQKQIELSKGPIRTRSGASGGLDLILPFGIYVNAPILESFATKSPLILDIIDNKLVIKRGEDVLTFAELQPIPRYYNLHTSDGLPMKRVGQLCSGDRFCYGMTGTYCWFWKSERRCLYCSIGLNKDQDANQKTIKQLIEVLGVAISDPVLPAKHILLGGGTPEGDDMGAILASQLCREIKKVYNTSCYVMISAPLKNEYIDLLRDSGADELGINLEFYSESAWEQFIPGKNKYIGRKRYFNALEYSVKVFGPINTRSILIVGLEQPENTIEGAVSLAEMGIMPILSPFRPLTGSRLENTRGFSYQMNWDIYQEIHSRISTFGIPTGPTCIPCQNNVLALPVPNEKYKYY